VSAHLTSLNRFNGFSSAPGPDLTPRQSSGLVFSVDHRRLPELRSVRSHGTATISGCREMGGRNVLKSVEGVYRDGKVELTEIPTEIIEARVIVTFLPAGEVRLKDRGIDPDQAASLRARLRSFEEDWEAPGMEAYDAL
jgi:hypothetical protein